jgi:CheY-like chemotaxis protein
VDLTLTESNESQGVPSLYVVSCPSCAKEMAAHESQWCRCVSQKVSLTCPHCGTCLCKASARAQREFWRNAPAWVNESRAAEQRRRVGAKKIETTDAVDILIVDDDEEIRMLAAYSVEQMGYRVAVAGSGEEALAAIDRCRPRMMLTDALMPGLDGRELCQTVKAAHPLIKVVIMTSLYTAPRYKYEAYKKFKADGYLPKPIDFNQLHEVLVKLVPNPMGRPN